MIGQPGDDYTDEEREMIYKALEQEEDRKRSLYDKLMKEGELRNERKKRA